MKTTTNQTPGLDVFMRDSEEQFERCRLLCDGDDAPARLGVLEVWSKWADDELRQLRLENAHLEAALKEAQAKREASGVVEEWEEDAETARRTRTQAYADAWDLSDLDTGFIGRHVHE